MSASVTARRKARRATADTIRFAHSSSLGWIACERRRDPVEAFAEAPSAVAVAGEQMNTRRRLGVSEIAPGSNGPAIDTE